MEKLKVYKLTMNGGSTLYDQNLQNILDTMEAEMQALNGTVNEDNIDFEVSVEWMTQEVYDSLPEFDGF
jgi:hypothetical protein